jgi:electron transfer flavoprotein beta subunit
VKGIVVIKTASGGAVNAEDLFDRAGRTLTGVLGIADRHAIEAALQLRQAGHLSEVVIAAMAGSSEILGAVREGLAMGADAAFILADEAVEGLDILGRSQALARLLSHIDGQIFLHAPWSGDIDGSLLWAATSERMGHPLLPQIRSFEWGDEEICATRQTEEGDLVLAARWPCFLEVTEALNRPRKPSIKDMQGARAKKIMLLDLAALGLAAPDPAVKMVCTGSVASRRHTQLIESGGDTVERILDFLDARGLLP